MQKKDGMNYAPEGKSKPVVGPGEFVFAAVALDHGHIYGMCNGLIEAGATLKWVYDPDAAKVEAFVKKFPQVKVARSEREVLEDAEVRLIAGAAVPSERCALGLRAMDCGKDYFTDKCPFTTLEQLGQAKARAAQTKLKYMVYYSERLHVECAVHAGALIEQGAIGRVVQTIGMGPHRLSAASRPAWFFERDKYGGILCDIGSHQIEQFLHYTGANDATVQHSKVGNYNSPEYPELEDFGDATLVADNGATGYFRVDWLTPNGVRAFGDGRTFILGTEGFIELRKYTELARKDERNVLYLANHEGEQRMNLSGKVGYPFFGKLILDCLNRTEEAMTQAHAFKAGELCLIAQQQAVRVA